MKKVLILGAGIYQVSLIKKAKELNYYVIVATAEGNFPGIKYADKVVYLDITNTESLTKFAKEEGIDGVATAGCDVGIATLGSICDALSLKGFSYDSGLKATNKLLMKEAFVNGGVRTAKYVKCNFDVNYILSILKEFKYPVIFKAVSNSGSRGIIKVNNDSEVSNALEYVKEYSKKDYFIIEEFLSGIEFGAQAFVKDGKLLFVLPHGDMVFNSSCGVPVGHFVPYDVKCGDVYNQTMLAIQSCNIDNCAVNLDFILVDGKTYVLEIGARSGATGLAELVSIYYGFDYYELILKTAMNENINLDFNQKNECACQLMLSNKSGIIKNIVDNNVNNNDIVSIQFDYNIGDSVNKFTIGPDRIGMIVVKGNNSLKLLDEVYNNINIVVDDD